MRNPRSHYLQPTILHDPEPPNLNTQRQLYDQNRSILAELCLAWPAGSLDTGCPHPIVVTPQHQHRIAQLHDALSLAIADIVNRWWDDDEARFPDRMPIEPGEESLLRWLHKNADLVRPFQECQGSWRPDFLLEQDLTTVPDEPAIENFRICEINARFCWNGFMHAVFGQQALSRMQLGKQKLTNATDPDRILRGLQQLFDPNYPLHLLKGEEFGIDIHMFAAWAGEHLGIRPRFITPHDLRLMPDTNAKTGYKLCCVIDPMYADTSDFKNDAGEPLEEIYQVGLELHQREFRLLKPEMKRQLSLRCFNDMRTILLVHDKRMLGIVLQELESLVSRAVLTSEQAASLAKGITSTILPGSNELHTFIEQCAAAPQLKDEYILKPIRSGKGAGIIFGDKISPDEWMEKLEQLKTAHLQPGVTMYVVQRRIYQIWYDLKLGRDGAVQQCHMVGTYQAVNGRFLGLGPWRCSSGRLCAVSDGGTWVCSVDS